MREGGRNFTPLGSEGWSGGASCDGDIKVELGTMRKQSPRGEGGNTICRNTELGKEGCEDSRKMATAPKPGKLALVAGLKHLDFHPRAVGS